MKKGLWRSRPVSPPFILPRSGSPPLLVISHYVSWQVVEAYYASLPGSVDARSI